jgi:hypothetical protein
MGIVMNEYELTEEGWQLVSQWSKADIVKEESDEEESSLMPVELGDVVCRHHQLYSLLGGRAIGRTCRNDLVPPIFPPRGLPKDMNKFYADRLADWYDEEDGIDFGASWLMVRELAELDLDSHEVFHYGYVQADLAHLFAGGQPFHADFPDDAKIYSDSDNPDYPVKVTWSMCTLREYVEYSLQLLLNEDLLPLGPPDEVRVVYWFNW